MDPTDTNEEEFPNCPRKEDGEPCFNQMAQCCVDCLRKYVTIHCPRGLENEVFGIEKPFKPTTKGGDES